MPRIALVFCVLVAASLACKPRGAEVHLDPATFLPKLTERMTHVVSEPEVTAGFDTLVAAIGADPTLRTRGAALLSGMTADPATSAAMAAVMAELQKSPGLQRTVAELVAANPGVSPDQIGDLAGKRIETTWSSQPINQAWMRSWNRLRAKLELGALPKAVEAGISARIGHYFDGNGARWGERLIELNGGKLPGTERAVELYLDHAWTEDRMRRFLRGLLANPGVQHELIATLQRLLALPAVERELRTAAKALLSEVTVQRAAVELMNLLLGAQPAPAAVEQQLDALLLPAPVVAAINHMIAAILAEPAVPTILVDAFDHLAADPKLTADLHDLIDGW
jgi:hypothetical protein